MKSLDYYMYSHHSYLTTESFDDLVPQEKQFIFVCWANKSDCGKDEVSKIIEKNIPCTRIKFSRAFKTPLEQWLCIPEGSLDDKEFRILKVLNPVTEKEESFTYNDLMYHFFHKFKELYPDGSGNNWFTPGGVKNTILNTKGHMSIVDCRNQTELELLRQLSDKYNIVLLQIHSDRGEQKSTDKDISPSDWDFVYDSFCINNNKNVSLEKLEEQIVDILEWCFS